MRRLVAGTEHLPVFDGGETPHIIDGEAMADDLSHQRGDFVGRFEQRGNERIWRLEPSAAQFRRHDGLCCFELLGRIEPKIDSTVSNP